MKVTYRWREIDGEHAPAAPAEAVSPKDGADANLAPEIRWAKAVGPDGAPIVCYRFQLSLRPDCARPLCATFDRDVREGCAFQVPDGWLNPKTAYLLARQSRGRGGQLGPLGQRLLLHHEIVGRTPPKKKSGYPMSGYPDFFF